MTPAIVMMIGGALFAIFSVLTGANFMSMAKGMGSNSADFDSHAKKIGLHAMLGICTSVSGFTLLAGFIWFLVEKLAQ